MNFIRKYNTAATIEGVVLITKDAADFQANPTLAAGDVTISKDGGAFANLATLPSVAPAAGTSVQVALANHELACKCAVIRFIDQTATKEWEDQEILVETYGHALAQFPGLDYNHSSGRLPVQVGGMDTSVLTSSVFTTGAITASTFAANAVTSNGIAPDAIDASAFASDAVTEIVAGVLAGSVTAPTAAPTAPYTVDDVLGWLLAVSKFRRGQTATLETIYQDNSSTSLATSVKADNGTTFSQYEYE